MVCKERENVCSFLALEVCKEIVGRGGSWVQVCFYKMERYELVYMLRGKTNQGEDIGNRIIDGWEALDVVGDGTQSPYR